MIHTDLRQGGQKVAAGAFVLDEARAREKLAKFQLVDPRRYVLEFVKAAQLLGATRIEFMIDADELDVRFDGELITAEEFESLASASFGHRETARQQALRHLAIGQNAARTLRLKQFDYEILELEPRPVMRIYLREAARPSHLALFAARLVTKAVPESRILEKHCAHARLPIMVNGRRVSHGPQLSEPNMIIVPLSGPGVSGLAGLRRPNGHPGRLELDWLHNGVFVQTTAHPCPFGWARAIVDSSRLSLNLSQSAVVHDSTMEELLHGVVSEALLKSVTGYLAGFEADYAVTHRKRLTDVIATVSNLYQGEAGRAPAIRSAFKEFLEAAARLPLYSLANPIGPKSEVDRPVSINDVRSRNEETGRTRLYIGRRMSPDIELHDRGQVLFYQEGESGLIGPAFLPFADEVYDATDLLEQEAQTRANRRKWKAWSGLDRQLYPYQTSRDVDGIRVTIGFSSHEDVAICHVVVQQTLIATGTWHPTDGPGPFRGIAIELSGPLKLNRLGSGPEPDDRYRTALQTACEMIPSIVLGQRPWTTLAEQMVFLRTCLGPDVLGPLKRLFLIGDGERALRDALRFGVLRALGEQFKGLDAARIIAQRETLSELVAAVLPLLPEKKQAGRQTADIEQERFLDIVAGLPLFELANPSTEQVGRWYPLAELKRVNQTIGRSALYYSTRPHRDVKPHPDIDVLLLEEPWSREKSTLGYFVDDVVDVGPWLESHAKEESHRLHWENQPLWDEQIELAPYASQVSGTLAFKALPWYRERLNIDETAQAVEEEERLVPQAELSVDRAEAKQAIERALSRQLGSLGPFPEKQRMVWYNGLRGEVGRKADGRLMINEDHAVVQAALDHPEDPWGTAFVASALIDVLSGVDEASGAIATSHRRVRLESLLNEVMRYEA
jgi:hypothetical protein